MSSCPQRCTKHLTFVRSTSKTAGPSGIRSCRAIGPCYTEASMYRSLTTEDMFLAWKIAIEQSSLTRARVSPYDSPFHLKGQSFYIGGGVPKSGQNALMILRAPMSMCHTILRPAPLNVACDFATHTCILWSHTYDRLIIYTFIVVNTAITNMCLVRGFGGFP